MYSRDDVELALLAVGEGMSRREAAELVGCGETAVRNWVAGRLPHSCVFGQVRLSEMITENFRVWARNFFGFGHGRAASFPA